MTDSAQYKTAIYAFLEAIGIPLVETRLSELTFLPGLLIQAGTLLVDPTQLRYAGDILHEAGHIAVTLPAERSQLQDNITADRPDKTGDELAVLLWTYAACHYLDLPLEVVFHRGGYKGQSPWLIDTFSRQVYVGLPLLVWMGMTQADRFPLMTHWLRPVMHR